MDGVQLVRRIDSIDCGVGHEILRTGKTSTYEQERFHSSLEKIANCPIYIDDRGALNIRDLRTKAYIWKRKHKIEYIVVDYLQLMGGIDAKGKSREQVISEISRGLKMLAKELKIPVIALSQLSRACESRPDKMPQLSDLRESGAIEQDADEVIFLMRPEYYAFMNEVRICGKDYSPIGLVIGKIDKNRHGATKNIAMSFNAPTMHFTDHVDDLGYADVVYSKPNDDPPPNFKRLPYKDEPDIDNMPEGNLF